jgi:hypothetical protein
LAKLEEFIVTCSDPGRHAALDWLKGRINYERTVLPYQARQLKLDRMRQLLTRLGQPDAGLRIIHVAGTKGKGSSCAMIAARASSARLIWSGSKNDSLRMARLALLKNS